MVSIKFPISGTLRTIRPNCPGRYLPSVVPLKLAGSTSGRSTDTTSVDSAADMNGDTAEVSSPSATDTEGASGGGSFFFTSVSKPTRVLKLSMSFVYPSD